MSYVYIAVIFLLVRNSKVHRQEFVIGPWKPFLSQGLKRFGIVLDLEKAFLRVGGYCKGVAEAYTIL